MLNKQKFILFYSTAENKSSAEAEYSNIYCIIAVVNFPLISKENPASFAAAFSPKKRNG